MLQLHGQNTAQVAYNDRSEVTGYDISKLLDGAKKNSGGLLAAGQPEPKVTNRFSHSPAFGTMAP